MRTRNEQVGYENACDYLYYGYGFKRWYNANSALFDNEQHARKIWREAFEHMAEDF